MGWKGMQAVRYRRVPASGELSLPRVPLHAIYLNLRPPEKLPALLLSQYADDR